MPNMIRWSMVAALAFALVTGTLVATRQAVAAGPQETTQPSPHLTAEQISRRILSLINSLHTRADLTPAAVENIVSVKVDTSPKNHNEWGFSGKLTDVWSYDFDTVGDAADAHPYRLEFIFRDQPRGNATDMTAVCGLDFDEYTRILTGAGFKSSPYHGEHGRLIYWEFLRDAVSVKISIRGESDARTDHLCVSMLIADVNTK